MCFVACTSNVCSTGLDCVVLVPGSLRCVCPPGQMCSGTCEGTVTDISTSGGQTCEGKEQIQRPLFDDLRCHLSHPKMKSPINIRSL